MIQSQNNDLQSYIMNELANGDDTLQCPPRHLTREIVTQFLEKEKVLRFLSGQERIIYIWEYEKELKRYIPLRYDNSFIEENGKWGLKNNLLNIIILTPVYDEVLDLYNEEPVTYSYCKVKVGNKYGVVIPNKSGGETIIPPIYDDVMTLDDYSHGERYTVGIITRRNGKYGFSYGSKIDLEPIYDKVTLMKSGHLLIEKDGKCGLFGYGILIHAVYDEIQVPKIMGLIKARKGNVWGYFDVECNFTEDISMAFQTQFKSIWNFDANTRDYLDHLFNDYSSLLNALQPFKKDEEIVQIETFNADEVFDKIVIYRNTISHKVGLRHYLTTKDLIPSQYDELHPISISECCYKLNGKYGFVLADGKGTKLCLPLYDEIRRVESAENIIVVRIGDKWGVVNLLTESFPTELEYDEIIEGEHRLDFKLLIKKDGKIGVYMEDVFIPPIYDGLFVPEVFGWIRVRQGDEWGYIDVNDNFTPNIEEAYLCYC